MFVGKVLSILMTSVVRIIAILWVISVQASAAIPALLDAAVQKISADYDRWAYTQTTVETNEKGKVLKTAVVRFDPSKPYPEQFTPLQVGGKPPTAADLRSYRRRGERRGEMIAEAENAGTTPPRQTLGELMEMEHATLVEENSEWAVFEVPLKANKRLSPEKFKVLARIDKGKGAFESIEAQLRGSFRAEVVVKIKSGVGRLEFTTVDPQFAPTVSKISGSGAGSIMFVPVGRSYELRRSDHRRVKPFADKFQVKLGPLKTIDF